MYSCSSGALPYQVQSGDSLWVIAQRYNTTIQEIVSANPGLDTVNLSIGQIICIPARYNAYQTSAARISPAEQTLSNHMRMLWEQHVYWTRLFILSLAFDLPDKEAVTDRLLRNAQDFEAALIPFYGDTAAAKFSDLLKSHLTIAAELVQAAKDNNTTAANDAEKRWYENANQIADFLNSINPYWSAQEWQKMLYDHLAMTKEEAVDILTGKYPDSIVKFEDIERQALMMADMMTNGIVNQFPQYFR